MKVNRKFFKNIKKLFSLYNLAILACIIIIIASLYIIIKPNINFNISNNKEQVSTKESEEAKEIDENEARKIAQKKFKKLGEKNIKEESLKVTLIQRENEYYYYVTSLENTMEISQKGGKIIRINSANVD